MLAVGLLLLALGILSADDATWARVVQIAAGALMTLIAIRDLSD